MRISFNIPVFNNIKYTKSIYENLKEYFPEGRIARTTVEARAVISTKIEIECVAYKPL